MYGPDPEEKAPLKGFARDVQIIMNGANMQEKLELFLNRMNGEVISIIPNVRPAFQLMGATAKIDSLLIVEKTYS